METIIQLDNIQDFFINAKGSSKKRNCADELKNHLTGKTFQLPLFSDQRLRKDQKYKMNTQITAAQRI